MTSIGYFILGAVIVAAACTVVIYRHFTKRTFQNLNRMLDCAMQGEFTEDHFDESMLSSLETKFAQYLDASTVSSRNLEAEKDNIKTLIADISHQTKTPIANLLLYAQLLNEQELNAECRTYAKALEAQVNRLQSLIDALVKTSRLETGIIALHPIRDQLDAVIQSAVSQLIPKATDRQISLLAEPTAADAVFDPKWTLEAIVNLLDNAVKYTAAGGHITVTVTKYELFSCINIIDDGPGIREEEQPKIFQRFYRGTEHQAEEGVGIGLYLVRQIAEGQGGYIRVRSAKGQGSTFSLYLPRG